MIKKKNLKNKKGLIYSFIALLIISIIIITSITSKNENISNQTYSESRAIKNLDLKLKSITDDITRGIYIVGFRTLLASDQIILQNGNYFEERDKILSKLFINGTYNNQKNEILNGSTFNDFRKNIEDVFKNENIDLNLTLNNVSFSQDSPWHVLFTINITIEMEDFTKIASWKKNEILQNRVIIFELNDPLYIVETNKRAVNQIRKSNISTFVINSNITGLKTHINNQFYIESKNAPSYLDRLSGDFNSNEFGIESLVNSSYLHSQGLAIKERSAVDYIYFTNNEIDSQYNIQNLPSWFYLDEDNNNIEKYGVEELIIT